MENISLCRLDQAEKLQRFINEKWSENHALAKSQILLNFQHKSSNNYNFIVSTNSNDEFTAILGFIPTFQFDQNLRRHKDIWLSIWKADETSANLGIGFALLKWLEKNIRPQSIGAIGINKEVLKIYEVLGYKTGVLRQYYFINPSITVFNIAKVGEKNRKCFAKSSSKLKEISLSQVNSLNFQNSPTKSLKYLENRYLKHPYYKYFLIGTYNGYELNAIFILRKIEVNGSFCLRIVDIMGDYSKIGFIGLGLTELLRKYKSEYIDCLNYGLSEQLFFNWGFNIRTSNSIIPNYFEPFVRDNVDIIFACKSKRSDYIIFKGDSDQDRPSKLIKYE